MKYIQFILCCLCSLIISLSTLIMPVSVQAEASALRSGDSCGDPLTIVMNSEELGNNCAPYTNLFSPYCQSLDSTDVVYRMVLNQTYYNVYICLTADYDSVLLVLASNCSDMIYCSDDDTCAISTECEQNNPLSSALGPLTLNAGTYYLVADGYNNQCSDYCMDVWGDTQLPTATPTPSPTPTPTQDPHGNTCSLPIDINIPADLPFLDQNQFTCGRGDNFDSSCLLSYDHGEDIFYRLNVTQTTFLDVILNPLNSTYTGILIDDECPPAGDCLAFDTEENAVPHGFSYEVSPGTYYIMIDTWPLPECISQFDLQIDLFVPGDDCSNSIPLSLNTQVSGNSCHPFTDQFQEICQPISTASDVWYSLHLDQDAGDIFLCLNGNYNSVLGITASDCNTQLYCSDDDPCGMSVSCSYSDPGASAIGPVFLAAGDYHVVVDGVDVMGCGDYCLDISGTMPFSVPNTCSTADPLPCNAAPITIPLYAATDDYISTCPDSTSNMPELWYYLTFDRLTDVVITATHHDPAKNVKVILKKGLCGSTTLVRCDYPANTVSVAASRRKAGEVLWVIVEGEPGQVDLSAVCEDSLSDQCDSANILKNTYNIPGTEISNQYINTWFYNRDYSPSTGACTSNAQAAAPDVVCKIVSENRCYYSFTLSQSPQQYDISLYLVRDCSDIDGTCVAGSDYTSDEDEYFSYLFPGSGDYYLILDGKEYGDAGESFLDIRNIGEDPPADCHEAKISRYFNFDVNDISSPLIIPLIPVNYTYDPAGSGGCGNARGHDGALYIHNSGSTAKDMRFQWEFDNTTMTSACYLLTPDCTTMNNCVVYDSATGTASEFVWSIEPATDYYFIFDGYDYGDISGGVATISEVIPTATPTDTPIPTVTPTPYYCDLQCPGSALMEFENCGEETNNGCANPTPAFISISCGDIYCGTMFTEGSNWSGQDVYELVLDDFTEVVLTANSEIPYALSFLDQMNPGQGDCDDLKSADCFTLRSTFCSPGTLTEVLPPGIHWFYIHPNDPTMYQDLYPCPGPWEYWVEVECYDPPIQACCLPDGTCIDADMPTCYELGGRCNSQSPYPCAQSETCATEVTNDECQDAIPITLPFDTTTDIFWATDSNHPVCNPASYSNPYRDVWFSVQGNGHNYTADYMVQDGRDYCSISVFCHECGTLICVDYDDGGLYTAPEITWCTNPGDTYYICLGNQYPRRMLCKESGVYIFSVTDSGATCNNPPDCSCPHHGDVDYSGTITAGDAQLAFQITLGTHVYTSLEYCAADCNDDGSVTAGDAQTIFQVVLGLVTGCNYPL